MYVFSPSRRGCHVFLKMIRRFLSTVAFSFMHKQLCFNFNNDFIISNAQDCSLNVALCIVICFNYVDRLREDPINFKKIMK